jgi:hypothetical protein
MIFLVFLMGKSEIIIIITFRNNLQNNQFHPLFFEVNELIIVIISILG